MPQGTPSFGKRNRRHPHIRCGRCGKFSYHVRMKVCSACGFGRSSKRND